MKMSTVAVFRISFPEGIMQPKPYRPLPPIKKGDMLTTKQIHPEVLRILLMRGAAYTFNIKEPKPSTAHIQKKVKISKKAEKKKSYTLDKWLGGGVK